MIDEVQPEVREDLVQAIQSRIETGTYQINAEALAERLLPFFKQCTGQLRGRKARMALTSVRVAQLYSLHSNEAEAYRQPVVPYYRFMN